MGNSEIGELAGKFAEIREKVLKLSHNEENVGMFWKLTSFPIDPQFYGYTKKEQEELRDVSYDLQSVLQLLNLATPGYTDDILELASGSPSPEPDRYFDVLSLLSSVGGRDLVRNNGDRVVLNTDTFKGKYVMICCFNVPVVKDLRKSQEVVNICNELYSIRDDFEMVMVAKMNSLANDCKIFNHFFSGLPKSCLVVPFEDNQRRDLICKVFDLGLKVRDNYSEIHLLNGKGKVIKYYDNLDYYGAEAFPFTEDIKYKSNVECREVVFGNVSLETILRCNESSPDFVYKINPHRVEVPISQLSNEFKNKHVALYLCSEGSFLLKLLDMYEQCRAKQHDFEIVVIFLPFAEAIDPKLFQERIDSLLKRHYVYGCWCLPFNNSVSRRFWRLTRHFDTCGGEEMCFNTCDKLIVVGPNVEHMDVYGRCVMGRQGSDAFPFTVEVGIRLRMKELREIKLESLFIDGDVLFIRGNDRNEVISVKELKGKKIFLLIDKLRVMDSSDRYVEDYGRSTSIYIEEKAIMEEDHSFEMVYVDVKRGDAPVLEDKERNKILSKMPWFVCPINGTESTNLHKFLKLLVDKGCVFRGALVGFGEDGQIFCVQKFGSGNDLDFSSGNTLHHDAERILGYDAFVDHQMQRFTYPQYI